MKAFDGLTSTNSIADAGLWPYGEPESNQSVKDHFSDPDEHLAATGIPGGERTRHHTYFGAKSTLGTHPQKPYDPTRRFQRLR